MAKTTNNGKDSNTTTNQVAEIEIIYSTKVPARQRQQIKESFDAFQIFKPLFPDVEHRERMVMLLLNRSQQVLGHFLVSIGGVSGTICDPKIVFQVCLKANASSFMVAHNHPSGNLKPSQNDIDLSKRLREGAKLLDLQFLDSLIITNENYLSMADEGLL